MAAECRLMDRARSLIFHLTLLSFGLNAAYAIALQLLPSNTSSLTFNFALYSVCGAFISLLGCYGVIKASPTLLTIFSNHLLLDALISTIPRLLLLPVFYSLPTTLCSFFDPRHPVIQSDIAAASAARQHHQHQHQHHQDADGPWVIQRCQALTWLVLAFGGVVMVCLTVMQWMCAWRVREYARYLETRQSDDDAAWEKKKLDDAVSCDIEKG